MGLFDRLLAATDDESTMHLPERDSFELPALATAQPHDEAGG
jgi:hypothetical protein